MFYILIFSVLVLFALLDIYRGESPCDISVRRILIATSSFLLIFIAGLRDSTVDRDYYRYFDAFNSLPPLDISSLLERIWDIEPAFDIVSRVAVGLGLGVELVIFVFAAVGVGLKMLGISMNTRYVLAAIIAYYSNYFFLHEITIIRAGVAAGIFLISISLLSEGKYYKYFLLCGSVVFVHMSSIVLLPIGFLGNKISSFAKKIYLVLPIVGLALSLSNFHIGMWLAETLSKFGVRKATDYLYYMETVGEYTEINVLGIKQLIYLSVLIAMYFKFEEISKNEKSLPLVYKITSIALMVFYLFSDFPIAAYRISELLNVVSILSCSYLMYITERKIFAYCIVTITSCAFIFANLFRDGSMFINAYNSILF